MLVRRFRYGRSSALLVHTLYAALFALLLVLPELKTHAEYIGTGSPSGATCRVFVHATRNETRFALVESYADQDGIEIFDDFPVATPGIVDLPIDDVYRTLRPSFLAIQTFLLARTRPLVLEPRHCHTHIVASGAALRAFDATQLDAIYARVHQATIEDAQFPFLLTRDDVRTLASDVQSVYVALGANYLDHRIPPTLTPGDSEVYGVLRFTPDALAMAFDNLERWKRSKRSKLKHTPLERNDFVSYDYNNFGALALDAAVASQLALSGANGTLQSHACVSTATTGADATKCMRAVRAVVDASNAACPTHSYCACNSIAQPRPFGAFYGVGLIQSAAVFASRFLQQHSQSAAPTATVPVLALPTPTLAALREATTYICKQPLAVLLDAKLTYARQRTVAHVCLDLSAAVVLLQAFGVQDADARVVLAPSASTSRRGGAAGSDEATAWLTGAFLSLEALQQRKAFAVEAELLAVQVDEGVPIGFQLSAVLLVAALAFLYVTAVHREDRRCRSGSSSFVRVAGRSGSGRKAKHAHSTQSIVFVDDASE